MSENPLILPHYSHDLLKPETVEKMSESMRLNVLRKFTEAELGSMDFFRQQFACRIRSLNFTYTWRAILANLPHAVDAVPEVLHIQNKGFIKEVAQFTTAGLTLPPELLSEVVHLHGGSPISTSIFRVFTEISQPVNHPAEIEPMGKMLFGDVSNAGLLEVALRSNSDIDTTAITGFEPLMDVFKIYGDRFSSQF